MDETAPTASSALRSKESPSSPIFDSGAFLFNSSARRGGDLTLSVGGVQTVMGTTTNGCSSNPPKRFFCLQSRLRRGLRVQDYRSLNCRRLCPLRLLSRSRWRRRGRLQSRNLGQSRLTFLSVARGFPLHTPGLPGQCLQLSKKLSPGGSGRGRPNGRDSHGRRRRGP